MSSQPHEFDEREDLGRLDQFLMALYLRYATPVDSLAYSETFDRMYEELQKAGETRTKGEIYRRMLMLRKSGRLPRLERSGDSPSEAISA